MPKKLRKKPGPKPKAVKEEELIDKIKQRYGRAYASESDQRQLAVDDLHFVDNPDGQWTQNDRRRREIEGRPCYTFNRTSSSVDQIKGDQRQNRPAIKVRAVDSEEDRDRAEILGGMIRNIEQQSDAETAYDWAFECAVKCGYGAFKIVPKYMDDSFDQILCVDRVENPLTVYFDPSAKDFLKRDAMWCIETERVDKEEISAKYPDLDFSIEIGTHDSSWFGDDQIRIANYYEKVPTKKVIAELSNGEVVDYDDEFKKIEAEIANPPVGVGVEPVTVERKRTIDSYKVRWWKVSGSGILEGPVEYDWKYIPIVPVFGRASNIEGKRFYRGLVRFAKDAQRTYNALRSSAVEAVALTPRAPYLVTDKQIRGYEQLWKKANVTAAPYLVYNSDPQAGGKPNREPPPDVPNALMALSALAADDIRATTGYYQQSLGEAGGANESGVAQANRNRESDVGSYEFIDNLGKSIKLAGEIMVDMIPQVYDTERMVRTLGMDGRDDFVKLNGPDGTNLDVGTYDVAVTIGPAYTTQRQEAFDALLRLAGASEQVQTLAPDLIAKNLDVPGAEELERRLRIPLIQQGVIEADEDEQQFLPQPAQPDPVQQALVDKAIAEARSAEALAQKRAGEVQMQPLEMKELQIDIINKQLKAMIDAGEIKTDLNTGELILNKDLQQ